jgi:hypothetical protein
MAGTLPSSLTYKELYGEPANNPFGTTESKQLQCYRAVYKMWKEVGTPLKVEKLHHKIVADFICTIGGVGEFVASSSSATDRVSILHVAQSYPGAPSVSHDRLITFVQRICHWGRHHHSDI